MHFLRYQHADLEGRFRPCYGGAEGPPGRGLVWGELPATLVLLGRDVRHSGTRATSAPRKCIWAVPEHGAMGLPVNAGPPAGPIPHRHVDMRPGGLLAAARAWAWGGAGAWRAHAPLAGAHARRVLSPRHEPSAQRDFCARVFNADHKHPR